VSLEPESPGSETDFGAIVIGAGFGGIQMLYELEQLGVSARLIEAASDVGGTWYWNRYPGARTDSPSEVYSFSFSKELWQEWGWSERYPSQPEVLRYLQHVTDRFNLRKYMQFDTRVESATYDETADRWMAVTSRGQTLTGKFLILATGPLSVPLKPPFEGMDSFQGDAYLSARWPHEEVDVSGKRVGVIGVGATGTQVVPVVAKDASHVYVFQRTPNYVIEAGNRPLSAEESQSIKDRYDEIREAARISPTGQAHAMAGTSMKDFTPEQVQELLEKGWQEGGFNVLASFSDVISDLGSNEVFCEFIRNKIRSTVKDPVTAELLCPKGYPFGAKRPPFGHGYYETFNRDNVTLVDVRDDPIERITPTGLRTTTDEYDLDVIIVGVGFDASTGAILSIDIRGRDGQALKDRWADGPQTYLGVCVDGFPNMFMVAGPQSPFANVPVVIDNCAHFISRAINYVTENDLAYLDPTSEAREDWCAEADSLLSAVPVMSKGAALSRSGNFRSFFLGSNVPGKPLATYFYFGGVALYRQRLEAVVETGFAGFATGISPETPPGLAEEQALAAGP
jgi:cation diffusion facilitator CzcD-associated flavoprotein CzcO